VFETHIDL